MKLVHTFSFCSGSYFKGESVTLFGAVSSVVKSIYKVAGLRGMKCVCRNEWRVAALNFY